jgi:hypothetical protein
MFPFYAWKFYDDDYVITVLTANVVAVIQVKMSPQKQLVLRPASSFTNLNLIPDYQDG